MLKSAAETRSATERALIAERPRPLSPLNPGPVPEDWEVKSIGSVSHKVTNGFVGSSLPHQVDAPGIPYLQGFNVRPSRIDLTKRTYVTPEFHSTNAKSRLKSGDILVVQSGHIGTVARVPDGFGEANCHALIIVDVDRDTIDPDYVVEHLNSTIGQARMRGLHVGSSMLHINTSELAEYLIPLPSLPEQRKIADILRTWDEAIEKLEALRAAKLRRLDGVSQRLLAPSRAIGHGIPRSNWAAISFGEVFDERQDKNANLGPDDVVTVGKYAIRKQSEHFTRSVASKDLSNYWTISPGDFVYDPMSAYYGAIGRFSGSADGIVSPAYRVIRLRPDVDPAFMVALLRTHHIRFLLETRSSQGNKEGKRRLLQRDEFESIEFKLPPIQTQREIAAQIAVFRAELDLTDREIEALTRQKRGLTQKLLTGEWRVSP
jgi:type I restriction enzyme S subunit